MKKFSKISKTSVNQEPKVDTKISESDIFKAEIVKLTNKLLKIQSYGAVDNRFLSGSVKIEGKEMLAEAILDLLQDKNKKEQTKILENLKSKVKDWEAIDKTIEEINKTPNFNNKVKFNKILEKYKDDSLVIYMESIKDKLNEDTINDYIILLNESDVKTEYKNKIINLIKN